ncbi:hypothetical protein F2Q68_00036423 [Brassica cretica]|uniref:Uncharacterized protein n=1 Tax=Brassica cretica TaxID=69181 RepID=A0A8S9H1N7_BRACR|nr:hypothetical protein F2Q68_00036423 [Brassica cretica]
MMGVDLLLVDGKSMMIQASIKLYELSLTDLQSVEANIQTPTYLADARWRCQEDRVNNTIGAECLCAEFTPEFQCPGKLTELNGLRLTTEMPTWLNFR